MNLFKRWRIKRQIKQAHALISKLKAAPHANWVEITRCNSKIRRLSDELAGVQPNQKKEVNS